MASRDLFGSKRGRSTETFLCAVAEISPVQVTVR